MWPTFPELGGLSVRRDVNRDLSIDNETDDDDASEPRQTGPRVSFSASQTDDDFFFKKNFVLVQSCYGIQLPL